MTGPSGPPGASNAPPEEPRPSGAPIGPETAPDPVPGAVPPEPPEQLYRRYAADLVAALDGAVAAWVRRCVVDRYRDWAGEVPAALVDEAVRAGDEARPVVVAAVAALVGADPEAQRTNPLSLLRDAVRYPTAVLAAAGVPPVVRDEFAERAFPEDRYDLAPASFADVGEQLHEPGLAWGAAKAHVVLSRRRARP